MAPSSSLCPSLRECQQSLESSLSKQKLTHVLPPLSPSPPSSSTTSSYPRNVGGSETDSDIEHWSSASSLSNGYPYGSNISRDDNGSDHRRCGIDIINADSITSTDFVNQYLSIDRPVLIKGITNFGGLTLNTTICQPILFAFVRSLMVIIGNDRDGFMRALDHAQPSSLMRHHGRVRVLVVSSFPTSCCITFSP
jgi:hypothetical protein